MKARVIVRSVATQGGRLVVTAKPEGTWHSDQPFVLVVPSGMKSFDTYRVGRELEITVVPK